MRLKNKVTGRFTGDTTEQFIEKAIKVHNLKYDYSKANYVNNNTKLIIICSIHGEFQQTPAHHKAGSGCQKCAIKSSSRKQSLTTNEFKNRALNLHKNLYGYDKVEYVRHNIKVNILCKKCNSYFLQTPAHHLEGNGCRKCNSRWGWTKSEWLKICNNKTTIPLVYIVRCFNSSENFIKIGMTSDSIQKRFRKIPYSYEIIKEIKGSADFVWNKEIELHRKCKSFKHNPLISFGGETECFNISILELL